MAIEVVGSGRIPKIKEKATEMLDRWVNEFVDEMEALGETVKDDLDEGYILAAWLTATYSMHQHLKKLVERNGKVVEIPQTKGDA